MQRALDLTSAFGKVLSPQLEAALPELFDPALARADSAALAFADGSSVPVVRNVPRFVPGDRYAASFSLQWSTYTTTQLDSAQSSDLTEQDLTAKTGLTPDSVRDRLILDAGVGIGRHSEVLARWGAQVVGVDLSAAVEAARDNLAAYPNTVVLQADIGRLPFRHESFDYVISIGVLHHTPDTRAHTGMLVPYIKRGGELAIWVYPPELGRRAEWVPLVSRMPLVTFREWCEWIVDVARAHPGNPWLEAFRRQFPFFTHHATAERSVLALFDGYTPTYHWVHSVEEVLGWLRDFGLTDVRPSTMATSARGRRPIAT